MTGIEIDDIETEIWTTGIVTPATDETAGMAGMEEDENMKEGGTGTTGSDTIEIETMTDIDRGGGGTNLISWQSRWAEVCLHE